MSKTKGTSSQIAAPATQRASLSQEGDAAANRSTAWPATTLEPSVIDLPAGTFGRKKNIKMPSRIKYIMTFLYSEEMSPAARVSIIPKANPPNMVPTTPKPPMAVAAKDLTSTAWPRPNEAKNSGAISTPAPPPRAALRAKVRDTLRRRFTPYKAAVDGSRLAARQEIPVIVF